jgi:hypothetical protein
VGWGPEDAVLLDFILKTTQLTLVNANIQMIGHVADLPGRYAQFAGNIPGCRTGNPVFPALKTQPDLDLPLHILGQSAELSLAAAFGAIIFHGKVLCLFFSLWPRA